MFKKITIGFCTLILTLTLFASKAEALTTISPTDESGDVSIESNENINDNVATAGNNVYIRGIIDDDLFVAGSNIKIEGEIKGNLFVAGNVITINGKIDQDAYMLGNTIDIEKEASIGRDLFAGGNMIVMNGTVGRNANAGAARLDTDAIIKGNANISASSFNLGDNAKIEGTLKYSGDQKISDNEASQIQGEITYEEPKNDQSKNSSFYSSIIKWLYSLLSFLFTGIILILLMPKWFDKVSDIVTKQTFKSMGIGFLILVVTPVIAIITLIILIGIPITIILTILYIALLYIAKYWVAYSIGKLVSKNKWSTIITMIVGVIILQLIFAIPILGGITSFLVMLTGTGAIWLARPLQSAK